MSERDPLRFTYEDARKAQLRDGLSLSTSAKVAFFEEMVAFAAKFGAVRRVREGRDAYSGESNAPASPTSKASD